MRHLAFTLPGGPPLQRVEHFTLLRDAERLSVVAVKKRFFFVADAAEK